MEQSESYHELTITIIDRRNERIAKQIYKKMKVWNRRFSKGKTPNPQLKWDAEVLIEDLIRLAKLDFTKSEFFNTYYREKTASMDSLSVNLRKEIDFSRSFVLTSPMSDFILSNVEKFLVADNVRSLREWLEINRDRKVLLNIRAV